MSSDLVVVRWERDFSGAINDPRVYVQPVSYSWHAIGGPERAQLQATGSHEALWECLEWLRCPIQIRDAAGEARWWGYISAVTITVGLYEVGVTLDTFANRVKVIYAERASDASSRGATRRVDTAWSSNTDSITAYGTKELILSADVDNSTRATGLRDQVLAAIKYPVPTIRVADTASLTARIECRGWFETLDWRYYSGSASTVGFNTEGNHSYVTSTGIASNNGAGTFTDSNNGFGFIAVSDGLAVSGNPNNDGYYTASAVAAGSITVTDELGNNPNTDVAGASITVENDVVQVGKVASTTKLAQSFQVPAADPALRIDRVGVYARRIADPTDRLYCDLHNDSGGSPNARLAIGTNSVFRNGSQNVPGLWGGQGAGTRSSARLNEDLDTSETGVDVTDGTQFQIGQVILIDSEQMWISGIAANVLTVTRGANSTTAATHSNGAAIDVYNDPEVPAGPPLTLTTWGLDTPVTLTPGTTYWLVLYRSNDGGATALVEGSTWYPIARNPDGGYANGSIKRWDGAAWQAVAGDLRFQVSGQPDTTEKIKDIVTSAGAFLAGTIVEATSGVYASSYEDGDQTGGEIIRGLLESGNSSGKRLIATVTQERYLRVQAEPATTYLLGLDGAIQDELGNYVPPEACPAGVWAKLVGVVPPSFDGTLLASVSPFFIERAEYSVATGRVRFESRGQPTARDLGRLVRG